MNRRGFLQAFSALPVSVVPLGMDEKIKDAAQKAAIPGPMGWQGPPGPMGEPDPSVAEYLKGVVASLRNVGLLAQDDPPRLAGKVVELRHRNGKYVDISE